VIELQYGYAAPFHGPLGRVATSLAPMTPISSGHSGGPLTYSLNEPKWVYLDREGRQVWP